MQAQSFERTARRPWWLALLLALFLAPFVAGLSACIDSPTAAPTISLQPSDTSAVAGSAATLSITASGPDITYQWQVSTDGGTTWTNIPDATQASYTTPLTTLADNGKRYRVVVSAAGISVNSSAVQLTVTPAVVAPVLTVQPAAQTATAPDPATFSVTASGTSPIYQWQRSTDGGATFADIAGAGAASYSTGATTTAMGGERYRVVVSNSAGSVTSSAVMLTVSPTPVVPVFTTQPANQSVTAGSAAAFTVAATGTPAPTLQWQRSTDGGTTFTNIADATDATFNTGLTTLSQNGERYRAVATNNAGSVTSNAATLTVNAAAQAPVITTNPTAQTVTTPNTATFTAAATGVPTPSWQWQVSSDNAVSFSNIIGATSASYTTPATTLADSGKFFRAVASNASGSINTNAVTLTVVAGGKAWQSAALIENDDTGNACCAQVGMDASGNLLAVWVQGSNIWSARMSAAGVWAAPVAVQALPAGSTASEPQLAVAPNGDAMVVWLQRAAFSVQDKPWASRYTPGAGWEAPTLLTPDAVNYQPAVAIDASGNAMALWRQTDGFFYGITARRHVSGAGWQAAVTVNTTSAEDIYKPRLGFDAAGNAIAVWYQLNAGRYSIWSNRFLAGGSWQTAELVETDDASMALDPQIAVDAGGNAVAVWEQTAGSYRSIWANRYVAGSGWGTAVVIETNDTGNASVPQIAVDGLGNALVVWCQAGSGSLRIEGNRYVVGAGWGTATLVSGSGLDAGSPSLASNAAGEAFAIWTQSDGTRNSVRANRFAPATGWGSAQSIEPAQHGNSLLPRVAVDADGNATAVWSKSGPTTNDIWANRYR